MWPQSNLPLHNSIYAQELFELDSGLISFGFGHLEVDDYVRAETRTKLFIGDNHSCMQKTMIGKFDGPMTH